MSGRYELFDDPEFADLYPYRVLQGGFPRLQLHEVVTLPAGWTFAFVGYDNSDILPHLQEHGFDFTPVKNDTAPLGWSLISAAYLRELASSRGVLTADAPFELDCTVKLDDGFGADIREILKKLIEQPALLLYQGGAHPAPRHPERDSLAQALGYIVGLLTVSDLNRRPVRSLLFELLTSLEQGMAEIVQSAYLGDDGWLECLSDASQARVLGWSELIRRRNLASGPMTHLTLADLVNVVQKSKVIRSFLGDAFDKRSLEALSRCVEIRNRVMHSTKPLVGSRSEVSRLLDAVETALDALDRMKAGRPRGA